MRYHPTQSELLARDRRAQLVSDARTAHWERWARRRRMATLLKRMAQRFEHARSAGATPPTSPVRPDVGPTD